MPLRITTWNVNGIRNPFGYQPWRDNRTFSAMFDILEADIVIMQELKIQRKDLKDDMVLIPGWDCFFSLPKHKKGYSGVGIYTRQASCAPIRAEEGILGVLSPPGKSTPYRELPDDECIGGYPTLLQLAELGIDPASLDAEGRCVILEFPAFVVLGVYSPANSSGTRDDYRFAFLTALDNRVRNLHKLGKRVILAGDLNVARNELDTAGAEDDIQKMGLTHADYISTPNRRIFNQLLEEGEVVGPRDEGREQPVLWDIVRGFHPRRQRMYTHWEQKINARPGNYGSRIDYVLSSIGMKEWFADANIQEGLMGSDHCPVFAIMKDQVPVDGVQTDLCTIVNPPDVFEGQQRLRSIEFKDHPALSAKLMPEFDKRRSIKDMFARNTSTQSNLSNNGLSDKSRELSNISTFTQADGIVTLKRSLSDKQIQLGSKGTQVNADNSPKPKRAKPNPVASKGRNQPTLNSFFNRHKSSANSPSSISEQPAEDEAECEPLTETPNSSHAITEHNSTRTSEGRESDVEEQGEAVVDPVESADKWRNLFSKPAAPRCEHNEPCTKLQTKVKGINSGRYFWICARPVGPSGSKERNTQWRCHTFIWASDWSGNT